MNTLELVSAEMKSLQVTNSRQVESLADLTEVIDIRDQDSYMLLLFRGILIFNERKCCDECLYEYGKEGD